MRTCTLNIIRWFCFGLGLLSLISCAGFNAPIAKHVAQPNNRPVRNFTSFSTSLRCLDNLLAKAKRPRILVSSTGINDQSNRIAVGADEMLVNAINQTNIKSRAYLFIDQSFEKDFGQLQLLTPPEDRREPRFYFRGAITQVDTNTVNDRLSGGLDLTNAPNPPTINGGQLVTVTPSINSGVSVVSVDLHLVSYPDKTILPGSSVANSMVVTNRTFGTGGTGFIKLTGFNLTLSFSRVESIGQAVRNLIELGTIELLGRHAGVPYWQCLNIEPTNEKLENRKRTSYSTTLPAVSVPEAQRMLNVLGYYDLPLSGVMDRRTYAALSRFQADKNLIATGDLNYDVYKRLQEEVRGIPPNGKRRSLRQQTIAKPRFTRGARLSSSGTYLQIKSLKSSYKPNENLTLQLSSKEAGGLMCFHQSGLGQVTQILPQNPGVRLKISKGFARSLPNQNDPFLLTFDTSGQSERVLCMLQIENAQPPVFLQNQRKAFQPLSVKRLEDIPANSKHVKDWVLFSKAARP